jgi:hypothetical protein
MITSLDYSQTGDLEALGCVPEVNGETQRCSVKLEAYEYEEEPAVFLQYEAELRQRPGEPWLSLESEAFELRGSVELAIQLLRSQCHDLPNTLRQLEEWCRGEL